MTSFLSLSHTHTQWVTDCLSHLLIWFKMKRRTRNSTIFSAEMFSMFAVSKLSSLFLSPSTFSLSPPVRFHVTRRNCCTFCAYGEDDVTTFSTSATAESLSVWLFWKIPFTMRASVRTYHPGCQKTLSNKKEQKMRMRVCVSYSFVRQRVDEFHDIFSLVVIHTERRRESEGKKEKTRKKHTQSGQSRQWRASFPHPQRRESTHPSRQYFVSQRKKEGISWLYNERRIFTERGFGYKHTVVLCQALCGLFHSLIKKENL